jgi:hypothetical protein
MFFTLAISLCRARSDHNSRLRVRQRDIEVLTFIAGAKADRARTPVQDKLQCVGGSAMYRRHLYPDQIQCHNAGTDDEGDVNWKCNVADLDSRVEVPDMRVSCEGWDAPGDDYVRAGSCVVRYILNNVDDKETEDPRLRVHVVSDSIPYDAYQYEEGRQTKGSPVIVVIVIMAAMFLFFLLKIMFSDTHTTEVTIPHRAGDYQPQMSRTTPVTTVHYHMPTQSDTQTVIHHYPPTPPVVLTGIHTHRLRVPGSPMGNVVMRYTNRIPEQNMDDSSPSTPTHAKRTRTVFGKSAKSE